MLVQESLLRRHVLESNNIEGINASPGMPEYDGHLIAARIAACGITSPNHLHEILARRVPVLWSFGGRVRTCGVAVGSRRMPHWQAVPELMAGWDGLMEQYLRSQKDHEEYAYILHAWLLCIHPWVDGNGRTSRLVWNMLRVAKGLPWHIEPARTKHRYYVRLGDFEDQVFKKENADVY